MIENKSYLENPKDVNARSSSRSPIVSDNAPSPYETMIDLATGKHIYDMQQNNKQPRIRSASPVSSGRASKSAHHEVGSAYPSTGQPRCRSESPNSETTTKPMIDLSTMSRLHERRGARRVKPLDAMIDLNSVDNPASPRSPSFGAIPFSSFPINVYRPSNRSRYSYKSKHYQSRPQRVTSPALGSPGFSPRLPFASRFNYPPNQRYPVHGTPMTRMESHGNRFQNIVSNPASETMVRPGVVPKRRNSMDSQDPVKKRRVTGRGEQPDVNPEEIGVRLNVNDLLELEREETKYIQDLSLLQAQLSEIHFKMQKMQQQLDKLYSSEVEIKQRIDAVRAKRVKILKDAQGTSEQSCDTSTRSGTKGDLGSTKGDNVSRDTRTGTSSNVGKGRGDEGDVRAQGNVQGNKDKLTANGEAEGNVSCNRGDLGFRRGRTDVSIIDVDKNDEFESNCNREQRSFEEENCRTEINVEKQYVGDNEVITSAYAGSIGQSKYRNVSANVTPLELAHRDVEFSSIGNDPHDHILSTNAPCIQHYPITSSSNDLYNRFKDRPEDWERNSSGTTREKLSTEVETFESSNGSTITLNSDGTLVLRKAEATHIPRKRSNPNTLEETRTRSDAKRKEYGRLSSDESQQFLGCLEITSTTDEPMTNDDDGPKEVWYDADF